MDGTEAGMEQGGSGRAEERVVYEWIWRHLPGPWPVRTVIALALVAATVLALFHWGFPALAPLMPFNDGTVSGG